MVEPLTRRMTWPVVADQNVEVHGTAVDEHVQAQRCDALGRRPCLDEGVLTPRLAATAHHAVPDVDDDLSVDDDPARRTEFETVPEVVREGLGDSDDCARTPNAKAPSTLTDGTGPPEWHRH